MSKVNDILLDFSAKKIQRLFINSNILRKYKEFLSVFQDAQINLIECIEQKKNSSEYIEVVDFGKFSKLIRQKNVISTTDKFLNSLNKISKIEIKSKVFLTSLLLLFFQEELIGSENNMNNIDKSIVDWVNEVTSKLSNFQQILNELNKIVILFNNFQVIFDQWKDYDKSKLIESILISYNNRCEHIDNIINGNDDTIFNNLNNESKEEMIAVLEDQKNDLLKQIKLTDPSVDIEYIRDNSHSIIEKMNQSYELINNEVASTMKKAYYDMLCDEVNSGNMLPVFDLIKDINNRLLILVPQKNKKSFNSKFETSKIIDMLTLNEWSDDLINHISFLVDTIFVLGAPCDDKEMKEWKNHIMSLTKDDFSVNLPLIFIQIQEKIDRIFFLLKELGEKKN